MFLFMNHLLVSGLQTADTPSALHSLWCSAETLFLPADVVLTDVQTQTQLSFIILSTNAYFLYFSNCPAALTVHCRLLTYNIVKQQVTQYYLNCECVYM